MERLSSRFVCRQKQIRLWIILTQVFGSLLLVPINPAASAILKNGESSNGYYWQKTSTNWKPVIIRYQCRSSVSGKIEKQQKCRDAGAVKPQSSTGSVMHPLQGLPIAAGTNLVGVSFITRGHHRAVTSFSAASRSLSC